MLTPINAVWIVIAAIILVQLFLFVACWCAMRNRFHRTEFDRTDIVVPCAAFLFYAHWQKILSNIDGTYDELTELVAGFFTYGYTTGAADKKRGMERNIEPYAKRYANARPFLPMVTQLLRFSYNKGQNNVR